MDDWKLNRIREMDDASVLQNLELRTRDTEDGNYRQELISTCEWCEMGNDVSDLCDEVTCGLFRCSLVAECIESDDEYCNVDRTECVAYLNAANDID